MEDELVDFEEVYDDKNQENKMYVHVWYFTSFFSFYIFFPPSINFNSNREDTSDDSTGLFVTKYPFNTITADGRFLVSILFTINMSW